MYVQYIWYTKCHMYLQEKHEATTFNSYIFNKNNLQETNVLSRSQTFIKIEKTPLI